MTTALHDLIHARLDLLMDRYAAETDHNLRAPGRLSRRDILDDFAAFMNQIIFRLRRAAGESAPEGNVENPARTHGAQRFQLGADLASVIDEYALTRRLIIELATEAGLALSNSEMAVLSAAIDDGVRGAVLEYTAAQDAERRKNEIFRETFIGILGHDLRSPLNAVVVGASTLLRQDLGATPAAIVRRVLRSAERMARMISDLLDFARGRAAEGIPIAREPVDLRDVCAEVAGEMRLEHDGAEIDLRAEGVTTGSWDRDRLAQTVSNLLSNAIAYGAPERPVRVRVGGDREVVTLSVTNEGSIIDPLEIPKLFDPFLRGEAGLHKRGSKGLGLGLFITKQIVAAHGGALHAQSSEAEGTTFTVRLPREAGLGS